ncbi:hypothetical protein KAR48_06910, partial [bacterium]|nr:hypothetical protein [bacterium]
MLIIKNRQRIRSGVWTCLFVVLIWGGISAMAAVTGAENTPEAVFKAAQQAGAKRDFKVLVQLVAPSQHVLLAFGTDMAVGMFVEFREGPKAEVLKKQYEKIQKSHNVKSVEDDDGEKLQIDSQTSQEVIDAHMLKRAKRLYDNVDVLSYVPALMGIVTPLPEMAEQEFFPQDELINLKVDGDRAVGKAGDK